MLNTHYANQYSTTQAYSSNTIVLPMLRSPWGSYGFDMPKMREPRVYSLGSDEEHARILPRLYARRGVARIAPPCRRAAMEAEAMRHWTGRFDHSSRAACGRYR